MLQQVWSALPSPDDSPLSVPYWLPDDDDDYDDDGRDDDERQDK